MENSPRWDIPAYPEEGDRREKTIYEAVGYALSQWETLELSLGALYGEFLGLSPDEAVNGLEYRSAKNFEARQKTIQTAACKYFIVRCDQYLENILYTILSEARSASCRRNDIAHGLVQLWKGSLLDYRGFTFVPPAYTVKKFPEGKPLYAFSSLHIQAYGEHFLALKFEVNEYHSLLL